MRQQGLSWSEIARRTNVSRGTCQALAQVSILADKPHR
jgi:hypothetical protein